MGTAEANMLCSDTCILGRLQESLSYGDRDTDPCQRWAGIISPAVVGF